MSIDPRMLRVDCRPADFQDELRKAVELGWQLVRYVETSDGLRLVFERAFPAASMTSAKRMDLAARSVHAAIRSAEPDQAQSPGMRRVQHALDLVQEFMPWRRQRA